MDVPNLEHGAVVRKSETFTLSPELLSGFKNSRFVPIVCAHPELPGPCQHHPPDHQAVPRLEHVQGAGDVWEAHGANKH